jgi:DNA repair protein RadC
VNVIDNYELKVKRIRYSAPYGTTLETSDSVARIAASLIGDKAQEHFIVLATNVRNEVIGYWIAGIGSISSCPVDMRSVFRMAVVVGATGICCAHNHPSSYVEPSNNDIDITKKIRDAAKVLDLIFIDHVIVSGTEHYSMRAKMPGVFG